MKDLISIIVPIYKVENFLNRCIESIVSQTYDNIEIILVDDGSPDNCPIICDEWAKKDGRVKVIHKKNGGLSDARNAGIDNASGEYVLFVDADDSIDVSLCEKVMTFMRPEIDIVSFGYRRVYDDCGDPATGDMTFELYDNEEAFRRYINRTPFTHMAWDKLYRRTLFEGVRFIKGRLAEDMAMTYLLFAKARKVGHLNYSLYLYYIRENSIMGTGKLQLVLDAYKGECEAYQFGCINYPKLQTENDTRFLNQSMKVYLKLTKITRYASEVSQNDLQIVDKNIKKIHRAKLSIKTKIFYLVFSLNKTLAWILFRVLKLS